jgi:DNA helicase HerA-like ATPase
LKPTPQLQRLAADLVDRVHDDQDPDRLAQVDGGRAIAYGLELGLSAVIRRNPFAASAGGRD